MGQRVQSSVEKVMQQNYRDEIVAWIQESTAVNLLPEGGIMVQDESCIFIGYCL